MVNGAFMALRMTPSRLISVLIGALLIVPIAFVTVQETFGLRRSDVMNGLKPLVAIPLVTIRNVLPVSREVVVPSDESWKRMTDAYGQPKWLISVVNVPVGATGYGRRTYTYEEVGLHIKVFRGTSEVPLEPTTDAPYGYSSQSESAGWLFQAAAGERILLVIESPAPTHLPEGEIVLVPDWPRGDIPGALDAFAIVHGLRWILVTSAAVGIALIVFGVRRPPRTS
jgi:hypothetical protein